jgi:hypothetical protein
MYMVLADQVLDNPLITVVWNAEVQEILGKDLAPQQHNEEEMVDNLYVLTQSWCVRILCMVWSPGNILGNLGFLF